MDAMCCIRFNSIILYSSTMHLQEIYLVSLKDSNLYSCDFAKLLCQKDMKLMKVQTI